MNKTSNVLLSSIYILSFLFYRSQNTTNTVRSTFYFVLKRKVSVRCSSRNLNRYFALLITKYVTDKKSHIWFGEFVNPQLPRGRISQICIWCSFTQFFLSQLIQSQINSRDRLKLILVLCNVNR